MISFAVQTRLSFIRSHLFIFAFISFALETDAKSQHFEMSVVFPKIFNELFE